MARPAKEGVKRSFLIEKELSERLDKFCYDTARTRTRVVEIAIEEYLERHSEEEKK